MTGTSLTRSLRRDQPEVARLAAAETVLAHLRGLFRRPAARPDANHMRRVTETLRDVRSPTPTRTVILCTDERTGSHYLADILASTGVLGRAYEYFNTEWMKQHYEDYPDDVLDQLGWARRLGTTRNGVLSLKLHPWAMDRISPHIDLCKDLPNPCFVALHRADLLGQAISLHKAQTTRSYTSWSKPEDKPVYDGARIKALLSELAMRRERWELYFARNAIAPLRIEYDYLRTRPREVVSQVSKFVGVKARFGRGGEEWYHFERQSDGVNDSWRSRFLAEFGDTRRLDPLPADQDPAR